MSQTLGRFANYFDHALVVAAFTACAWFAAGPAAGVVAAGVVAAVLVQQARAGGGATRAKPS